MFIEKKWVAVPARPMTFNGTANGIISVASVAGFYVKQLVILKGNSLPTIQLQIKRVLSDKEIAVGPVAGKITDRSDVSAYTVAANSTVEAAEQDRNDISLADRQRAIYAEEPIVAKRVVLVDDTGDYHSESNPIPVKITEGNITIENANIDVNLSDKESSLGAGDYDITRIGDGTDQLGINSDGSINIKAPDLETALADIDSNLNDVNTNLNSIESILSDPLQIDDPIKISGTSNGLSGGTEYVFVYNVKQQILASHDRDEQYSYADFGTKNERIIRVEYVSPTFPGVTVRRDFNYTLVSGSYRMDSSVWSVV